MVRYENNMFQGLFHNFLVFMEAFLKEVSRSRFGGHFGSSKNLPKHIGIHQESLIRHFGIIKTARIPSNFIKIQETNKNTYLSCRI